MSFKWQWTYHIVRFTSESMMLKWMDGKSANSRVARLLITAIRTSDFKTCYDQQSVTYI